MTFASEPPANCFQNTLKSDRISRKRRSQKLKTCSGSCAQMKMILLQYWCNICNASRLDGGSDKIKAKLMVSMRNEGRKRNSEEELDLRTWRTQTSSQSGQWHRNARTRHCLENITDKVHCPLYQTEGHAWPPLRTCTNTLTHAEHDNYQKADNIVRISKLYYVVSTFPRIQLFVEYHSFYKTIYHNDAFFQDDKPLEPNRKCIPGERNVLLWISSRETMKYERYWLNGLKRNQVLIHLSGKYNEKLNTHPCSMMNA